MINVLNLRVLCIFFITIYKALSAIQFLIVRFCFFIKKLDLAFINNNAYATYIMLKIKIPLISLVIMIKAKVFNNFFTRAVNSKVLFLWLLIKCKLLT